MLYYDRVTSLSRYARNKSEILCICIGRAKSKQSRGHLQVSSDLTDQLIASTPAKHLCSPGVWKLVVKKTYCDQNFIYKNFL